jgi:uncharacterized phiE125 gp8 family phage protein
MTTCYPISKPVRSAVPTFEPITVAEAKRQLGLAVAVTQHDVPIGELVTFAREQVERDAMLVVATGTFTVKRTDWGYGEFFELPSSLRPVSAVTAITYVDTAGTTTTWSTSQYAVDTATIAPIVKLAYGYTWPALRGDINGVTITATAGYAQTAIPKRVKQAVILRLQHEWQTQMGEQREADLSLQAYERIVSQLRHEVYA